jgi:hypothetical protein
MADSALMHAYRGLERAFPVTEDPSFARLVVPNGNAMEPVHRWFHLKEAFSVDLVPTALARWSEGRGAGAFLDPFAGVGTGALVAAADGACTGAPFSVAYGIEANPFLHFVAQTKARARTEGADGLIEVAGDAARLVQAGRIEPGPTPGLSSFSNAAFFPPADLRRLLQLRAAVDLIGGSSVARDVARLCLAASLEPASFLRRDGRALRHAPRKSRADPVAEFLRRVELAAEDVAQATSTAPVRILLGDGRHSDEVVPAGTRIRASVFSPPYLNNIDYTEIYKLEAWFLGYYADESQFREQRLRTVRSHPSVKFPEVYGASANGHREEFDLLISPLLAAIPNDRYRAWRGPLFRGYFDDMFETLRSLHSMSAPDSLVVYVVGNSLHGSNGTSLLVAADLVMARLAELAGFEVIELVVGRRPGRKRVDDDLLRESVVALKPRLAVA